MLPAARPDQEHPHGGESTRGAAADERTPSAPLQREDRFPTGAGADKRHWHAERVRHEVDVRPGCGGQLRAVQVLSPSLQLLEHGCAVVEVGLVRREVGRLGSVGSR